MPVRIRSSLLFFGVAQQAEQSALNRKCVGSNPSTGICPHSLMDRAKCFYLFDGGSNPSADLYPPSSMDRVHGYGPWDTGSNPVADVLPHMAIVGYFFVKNYNCIMLFERKIS